MELAAVIKLLERHKRENPSANKAAIERAFQTQTYCRKERSVYVGKNYAIRFSEANTPSFSNVVLSLSALRKYDAVPVVVCIVRPAGLEFRLANATFLKRVSHSSHALRTDNIRGSFLGHDIVAEYDGIANQPQYFDQLFALHVEYTWEENVARLVEATNAISARSSRFEVTSDLMQIILSSPRSALLATKAPSFSAIEQELTDKIELQREQLLEAAALENVNLRGNRLEQIITAGVNAHRLDDISFDLPPVGKLVIDVKTKLLDRASAPKAYNIDKMLRLLSREDQVFAFFFVGLDVAGRFVAGRLVSIFDPVILRATRIQSHWAGRASRGVTQLTGDISRIFDGAYQPSVDLDCATAMLAKFISR